eukprot:m.39037 g.39037  ORF g.39037 m.39037 type:complete len:326 (+) comp9504_c0_seq1:61-1038(+)
MEVPPPPPPGGPTAAPPTDMQQQQQPPTPPPEPPLPDPGPYMDMHRETMGVLAGMQFFDGARFVCNRGVSQNMQVTHTITLGSSVIPTGYRFGPTYVGTQKIDPNSPQQFPVMISEIDGEGNLSAQIIHSFNKKISTAFSGRTQGKNKWMVSELTGHYAGDGFQFSCTAGSLKPASQEGVGVMSYMQKITPKLTLGSEWVYQSMGGHAQTVMNLAGRYRAKDWTFCTSLGAQGTLQCTYHHKWSDQMQYATQLQVDILKGEATGTLGYHKAFRSSQVRGQFSTKGEAMVVVDQEVLGPNIVMQIAGMLNHGTGDAKFGLGFTFNN